MRAAVGIAPAALVLLLLAAPAAAAEPLGKLPLGKVQELARSRSVADRLAAVRELGRRGDPKSLPVLLVTLADPDPTVRAHSAEALRVLGDERAVPRVARALDDPDATVRARAALALGDLGGKYVEPALTRQLRDPVSMVRAAAIQALGALGDPLALEDVLSAQKAEREDAGGAVTAAALIAAAKLGGAAGFGAALAIAGEKVKTQWLLRASAAHAAGIAGDAGRLPWLEALLAGDEDPRVAQAAAAAMARLGARDALLHGLEAEKGFRRRAAVSGLAELGGEEVLAALIEAARDEDPGVRLEAAAALLGRGRVMAFPVAIDLLEGEPVVWLGALGVLEGRTGKEFGRNPARWREWFETNREKLVFRPKTGRYEIEE